VVAEKIGQKIKPVDLSKNRLVACRCRAARLEVLPRLPACLPACCLPAYATTFTNYYPKGLPLLTNHLGKIKQAIPKKKQ